jgi:CPA2 family monovalent cation:H+ antiporter-2
MCLLVALLFSRLGVSALVAYLVAGAVAGPHALGLVDDAAVAPLAEMGASMLLFAVGLELDLDDLRSRMRTVGVAGILQISLTIAAGIGILALAGQSLTSGVAIGACVAVSSTLLLLRVLDERGLRNRVEGRVALGLCLMQDVALGPLLLLLSFLLPVGPRPPLWQMAAGLVGILVLTVLLRMALTTVIIRRMRAARLGELEVVFAVLMALGSAAISHSCGLGSALGAFCAGLAFGSNNDREEIEVAMKPLQGLMAIFFFVATGLLFDPRYLISHLDLVVPALLVSVVGKSFIAAAALRIAGLKWRSALGCGILVGNIGEFSFVLADAAFANAIDPGVRDLHHLVVTLGVLSFLIMPLLVKAAIPFLPVTRLDQLPATGDTVVVAGLGPVGNTVVETLRSAGLPLLLVDRNDRLLAPWRGVDGITCHRGRIEDMDDWLPRLGHRPGLVVLTFPIADASALVTERLRQLDPSLIVIARSPFAAQIDLLRAAGARYVICDEDATAAALLPMLQEALVLHTNRDDGNDTRSQHATASIERITARIQRRQNHPS